MDLRELCEGSYEAALTTIEKHAEAVRSGHIKTAFPGELGLGAAPTWSSKLKAQLGDTSLGKGWNSLSTPAQYAIGGAGAGAGLGALGSMALGPRRKKRPLFGAALGGLLGGAGLGAYGLMGTWPGPGKSPAETVKETTKAKVDADASVQDAKDIADGNNVPEAIARTFQRDPITGLRTIDPGFEQVTSGTLNGKANPVTDKLLTMGTVDAAGYAARRALPSGDVRAGMLSGKLPTGTLPEGVHPGTAVNQTTWKGRTFGGLPLVGPGLTIGTGEKIPVGAPAGTPAVPTTETIGRAQLRNIARVGRGENRPRFAGTPLPRLLAYPAALLHTKLTSTMPAQRADLQLKADEAGAANAAAEAALPPKQLAALRAEQAAKLKVP